MQSDNYLDSIASLIRREIPSHAVPATAGTESLFRMYAILLEACGQGVSARDVHNAWVAWMLERDPSHPALVPYGELPEDVARQDDVYVSAIRSVALTLSGTNLPLSEDQ